MGGTTIRTYSSVDGVHGLFQNELFVHGKIKIIVLFVIRKLKKLKLVVEVLIIVLSARNNFYNNFTLKM